MPSPTEVTVPTSRMSTPVSVPSICCWMILVISSALMLMTTSIFVAPRQRHGRGDLVGHDAVLLAPGLGKRVHDPRQELQALVVEEEGEEARRLRARPGAGHDLVEDGLFFRGGDERAGAG